MLLDIINKKQQVTHNCYTMHTFPNLYILASDTEFSTFVSCNQTFQACHEC